MSIWPPLCQHDTGTAPLVKCWTCNVERPNRPWERPGNPSFSIRPCRGTHWHVTCAGEDIIIKGDLGLDAFSTPELAQAAADRLNERGWDD
jgi:hypothetical protein